jgi:hypothetical protein
VQLPAGCTSCPYLPSQMAPHAREACTGGDESSSRSDVCYAPSCTAAAARSASAFMLRAGASIADRPEERSSPTGDQTSRHGRGQLPRRDRSGPDCGCRSQKSLRRRLRSVTCLPVSLCVLSWSNAKGQGRSNLGISHRFLFEKTSRTTNAIRRKIESKVT